MALKMVCPCGKRLQVNDSLAGKRIKCPHCGHLQVARSAGKPEVSAPRSPRTQEKARATSSIVQRDEGKLLRMRAARILADYATSRRDDSKPVVDVRPIQAAFAEKLKAGDLAVISGGHRWFFHNKDHHREEVVSLIIAALEKVGDGTLAEHMINCSNEKLSKAAAAWASRHGFIIVRRKVN